MGSGRMKEQGMEAAMTESTHAGCVKQAVKVPFDSDIRFDLLLKSNLGSSFRYGLDISRRCFEISTDIAKGSEGKKEALSNGLKKAAIQLIEKKRAKGCRIVQFQFPEGSQQLKAAAGKAGDAVQWLQLAGTKIACCILLPLVLIGYSEAAKPEKLPDAAACYGLYLNTRIHWGNLFYSCTMGWGLSRTFNDIDDAVKGFSGFLRLADQLGKSAWPLLMKLYAPRLSAVFERSNRWMHST